MEIYSACFCCFLNFTNKGEKGLPPPTTIPFQDFEWSTKNTIVTCLRKTFFSFFSDHSPARLKLARLRMGPKQERKFCFNNSFLLLPVNLSTYPLQVMKKIYFGTVWLKNTCSLSFETYHELCFLFQGRQRRWRGGGWGWGLSPPKVPAGLCAVTRGAKWDYSKAYKWYPYAKFWCVFFSSTIYQSTVAK